MGPGFVTVTSDQGYKVAESTKEFFVLIVPAREGRFAYSWTARPSAELLDYAEKKRVSDKAKLVATRDPRFLRGAKMKRFAPMSLPADAETQAKLAALYAGG
jgi:hypothetical protein